MKYQINPGVVTDQMSWSSARKIFACRNKGTVSFDGKLQLESHVNEKMRSQLFRAIHDNFKPIDDPGYTAVNFRVSGTVGRPKTNLMDKLISAATRRDQQRDHWFDGWRQNR